MSTKIKQKKEPSSFLSSIYNTILPPTEKEEEDETEYEDKFKVTFDDPYPEDVYESEKVDDITRDPVFPIRPGRDESESNFFTLFRDFPYFMEFIYDNVCGPTANTLSNGIPVIDPFCLFKDALTYDFFMGKASVIYQSLSSEGFPEDIYKTRTPFYNGLKYIYANKIRRFKLSTNKGKIIYPIVSEHEYLVILNRLIYYYKIFLLSRKSKLRGFANSAGCVILTHGGYDEYTENIRKPIIEPEEEEEEENYYENAKETFNLKNVFICAKASPGCSSYGTSRHLSKPNSELNVMIDNIRTKGYVNFDQTAFQTTIEEYLSTLGPVWHPTSKEELKEKYSTYDDTEIDELYESMEKRRIADLEYSYNRRLANCYNTESSTHSTSCLKEITDTLEYTAMRHTISPKSKSYLNKSYQISQVLKDGVYVPNDEHQYVIDIEVFLRTEGKGLSLSDRLNMSNILNDSYFQDKFIYKKNKRNMNFALSDIVNYYKYRNKKVENLFIYDTSCGHISRDPDVYTDGQVDLEKYNHLISARATILSRKGLIGGTKRFQSKSQRNTKRKIPLNRRVLTFKRKKMKSISKSVRNKNKKM